MTATCTFSQFTANTDFPKSRHHRHSLRTYQADVTDFDGESHSFSFEAWDDAEAEQQAQHLATENGIDASYICVYQY